MFTDQRKHRRRMSTLVCAASIAVLAATQVMGGQEKGGTDETGPYNVVENWLKPFHEGREQCVLGVFAESPNRIYMVAEVEVPATRPVGNCSNERDVQGSHGHYIFVVDGSGKVIEDWSQWNGLFERKADKTQGMPHSVKISPYDPEKHVWVVNRDTHQIHKFTHDGKQLVMTLGERSVAGTDDKHFDRPADIAFFPDGSFVVADGYGNSRIVKFDRNGKYVTAWGTPGSGPGQFQLPHSVAIDPQRRVLVADQRNQRVQIFDENGKFLEEWPHIRGGVHLIITQDRAVWLLTGSTNRILKYDLNGKLLTYWGTANTTELFPGSLYAAHSFSVDSDGNLYVADYRNKRAQKFTPKPNADRSRLIGQPLK